MTSPATDRAVPRDELATTPPWRSVGELVRWAGQRFGDRELLRFAERSMSFAEVDAYTSRLANVLIDHGLAPGDRIALLLPNRIDWPLAWLAALKAGAIVVPINAHYRAADLSHVLEDSGASILLTRPEQRELVDQVRDACPTLREVRTLAELEPEIAAAPTVVDGPDVDVDDLANFQYTSGTTGFPKACMLPHGYWLRLGQLTAGYAELRSDDVVLTAQPFSYMDPQWNTVMCLVAGVPLVVLERFSASGFWPDVRRHGATVFYVLGTMPMLLLKQPPHPDDRANAVRLVLCSGIVPAIHAQLEQRWGAPWREAYGMTESGADLIVPIEAAETVGSGAIGRPVATKQVRIVDEHGDERPDGEVGEIVSRGEPMMLGYHGQPEATAATIRDGWLHTGDLGFRDADGWFHLVGRLKDMVRRGGENISCAEVEGVLGQHEAVLSVAVVAVPDELFGEEVKAFVLLRDPTSDATATVEALLDFARERLARFKLPRFVELVERFPLTPSERIAKPLLLRDRSDQRAGAYDAVDGAWH